MKIQPSKREIVRGALIVGGALTSATGAVMSAIGGATVLTKGLVIGGIGAVGIGMVDGIIAGIKQVKNEQAQMQVEINERMSTLIPEKIVMEMTDEDRLQAMEGDVKDIAKKKAEFIAEMKASGKYPDKVIDMIADSIFN